MLMQIKREYLANDWEIGMREEKDKQCKKLGPDNGLCSIDFFTFQGTIKSERNLKQHIAARLSYYKRYVDSATGEVVSLLNPVKYQIITPELKEEDCKYKRMMETQSRQETKRYALFTVKEDKLIKLLPYHNIEQVKCIILNMWRLDHYNVFEKYYVLDKKTGKLYRVCLKIQEVKTTTRVSSDLVHIVPIYKYIYYGNAFCVDKE